MLVTVLVKTKTLWDAWKIKDQRSESAPSVAFRHHWARSACPDRRKWSTKSEILYNFFYLFICFFCRQGHFPIVQRWVKRIEITNVKHIRFSISANFFFYLWDQRSALSLIQKRVLYSSANLKGQNQTLCAYLVLTLPAAYRLPYPPNTHPSSFRLWEVHSLIGSIQSDVVEFGQVIGGDYERVGTVEVGFGDL